MGEDAYNWQLNKTVAECNEHLLETEQASDIVFLVGDDDLKVQIKCHKYMLLARSPVFFAMFCGDLKEDTTKPIQLPDVNPDALKLMLRFIYTDKVLLNSEAILATLYLSQKYMLPTLTQLCYDFLEKNLDAENVCLIQEQCVLYDNKCLLEKCQIFLENRTDEVLRSSSFKQLSQQMLIRFLKHKSLSVTELEIFEASLEWATEECKRQDLEVTAANQRAVLGDAIFCIHFPCLSIQEFSKHVAKTGILSSDEKCAVFEYMTIDATERSTDDSGNPFPIISRHKPDPCVLNRFTGFGNTVVWSGDSSMIKVKVDRAIVMKGIGISGSLSYDPVSEIQVSLRQEKNELIKRSAPVKDDMSGDVVRLMLQRGISCTPGLWYTLACTVHFLGDNDQGYCQRGKSGKKVISCEGITFEFDRADAQSGLIHEIIFSK